METMDTQHTPTLFSTQIPPRCDDMQQIYSNLINYHTFEKKL